TIVGDFRVVPTGTASASNPGHYRYAVLFGDRPNLDSPQMSLSIAMVERVEGELRIVEGPVPAGDALAAMDARMRRSAQTILSHTQRGRQLQDRAARLLAEWSQRNDRSRYRLTTPEGLLSLGTDMALAGMTARAQQALGGANQVERLVNESMLSALGSYASSTLPGSLPPFNPQQAANVELTRGGLNAYLSQRLNGLDPRGREAAITYILTQAGGRLLANPQDDVARHLLDATADLAITWGLPPVVGPLAQEAVELARQLGGFTASLQNAHLADAEFTAAINEYNFLYGARQTFAETARAARPMMQSQGTGFWRYYGNYQLSLEDSIVEAIRANPQWAEAASGANGEAWIRRNFPALVARAFDNPRLRDYVRTSTPEERRRTAQLFRNTVLAEAFSPRVVGMISHTLRTGREIRPLRTSMAAPEEPRGSNVGRNDETRPVQVAANHPDGRSMGGAGVAH
ncbi:MAG TPA: hypothetical protein VMV18_06525, partial [bacterium]|nr:hypothetical protein [bacterium]